MSKNDGKTTLREVKNDIQNGVKNHVINDIRSGANNDA